MVFYWIIVKSFSDILSTRKEFKGVFGLTKETVEVSIITIMLLLLLVVIILLFIRLGKESIQSLVNPFFGLEENIEAESLYHKDDTLILLIPRMIGNNIEFLVERNEKWNNSYFFPYIKDKRDENLSDIIEYIGSEFSDQFSINVPIVVEHLHGYYFKRSKLDADDMPVNIHYRFAFVLPKSFFFKKTLEEMIKFKFKSVKELLNDGQTKVQREGYRYC